MMKLTMAQFKTIFTNTESVPTGNSKKLRYVKINGHLYGISRKSVGVNQLMMQGDETKCCKCQTPVTHCEVQLVDVVVHYQVVPRIRCSFIVQRQPANMSKNVLSVDHIIPRARGGDNSNNNKQLMCVYCNSHKSDELPSEEIMGKRYWWKDIQNINRIFENEKV